MDELDAALGERVGRHPFTFRALCEQLHGAFLMSVFVLLCIALAVAFVASLGLVATYDDGTCTSSRAFLGWAGCLCFGLSLLTCGVVAAVIYPSRAVGRITCRNWSEQTGYPTKFRVLNWADTGHCLAKTSNGRWVLNSRVIINVPAKDGP